MSIRTNENRIGVIDGIRAFAILWVGWYHLWQESWLSPYVELNANFLKYFGIYSIEIESVLRFGFVFVDVIMILSAFCVFLPYANSIINGSRWPDTKSFYIKRAIRILPSYYLTVFVFLFAYAIPFQKYDSLNLLLRDLITHLTFTSWLFPDTYYGTASNGVLWAVQIEVIFYILMPWLAKLFRKIPEITYVTMLMIGIVASNAFRLHSNDLRLMENNPLTFFPVYANGILICLIYVWWKKQNFESNYFKLFSTILSIGMFFFVRRLIQWYMDTGDLTLGKLKYRLIGSFIFSIFILATLFASSIYQKIFSNKLTQLFAIISYNYFIWHQSISRFLKYIRFPYWEGTELPNIANNREWMFRYTFISIIASFIVAIIVTKAYDIPITSMLTRKLMRKEEPNAGNN